MKIPKKYIIEMGMIRKRNRCAWCGEMMDVEKYNVQLCKKCRTKDLKRMFKTK